MAQILSLGDCNTLGIDGLRYHTYVEQFAKRCGKSAKNCGFTMSSTREMIYFLDDYLTEETQIITVQYGLVDTWKTFKHAPYVLYYPDSFGRKIARKLVKKYKKIARRIGLNDLFGETPVTDEKMYEENLLYLIEKAGSRSVFLIDTVPTPDEVRNRAINRYNRILASLGQRFSHVHYIPLYDCFASHPEYYLEGTHINAEGYEVIAAKLYVRYLEAVNGKVQA